jgi:hypothetical protein
VELEWPSVAQALAYWLVCESLLVSTYWLALASMCWLALASMCWLALVSTY